MVGSGYHDLDYLLNLLEDIKAKTVTIYTEASNQLQNFGLIIDQKNTSLIQAQEMAHPSSEVPLIISFDEYKYLQLNNNSNAAQYVISFYESSLRGPSGTNALDISNIVSYINNETARIKDFIDEYIGEVDDTSEQRAVELFQDWAEDTAAIIEKFWQALKGEIAAGLPESELGQLTTETASQFQALLQVKLNRINKNINDLHAQLVKNWENTSNIFYQKHLGPALKFQLKVGRNLSYRVNVNSMPVISNEILGTMSGVDSNFSGILADQIKRNKMFIQAMSEIILNIAQRDTYFRYMKDLTSIGKPLPNIFTNSSKIDHPDEIISAVSIGVEATMASDLDFSNNFDPVHSSLTGLDNPLAHPQYLLRSGGLDSIVTGDIYFESGVRIDGIVPSTHRHNGSDGSIRLTGADIDYNSISEENINTTDPTTSIPENLILLTQNPYTLPPGIVKVVAQVGFDVTTADNITGYEFEVTKLSLDIAEAPTTIVASPVIYKFNSGTSNQGESGTSFNLGYAGSTGLYTKALMPVPYTGSNNGSAPFPSTQNDYGGEWDSAPFIFVYAFDGPIVYSSLEHWAYDGLPPSNASGRYFYTDIYNDYVYLAFANSAFPGSATWFRKFELDVVSWSSGRNTIVIEADLNLPASSWKVWVNGVNGLTIGTFINFTQSAPPGYTTLRPAEPYPYTTTKAYIDPSSPALGIAFYRGTVDDVFLASWNTFNW